MALISSHKLVQQLLDLDLAPNDYAIFGSGPMLPCGLHDPADLDVIARGHAWSQACAFAEMFGTLEEGMASFADGAIQIFNDWEPGLWDIGRLIDESDIICGVAFVRLREVLRWKRLMGRPKDLLHCRLIQDFLKETDAVA